MTEEKNSENNALSLEALEAELRQMPQPAVPAELESRLLADIPAVKHEPRVWYRVPLVRAAVMAAIVVLAVLIGVSRFGGSIDGATAAFAQMTRAMEKVPWMRASGLYAAVTLICFCLAARISNFASTNSLTLCSRLTHGGRSIRAALKLPK